jgi:hypothetical protein
MLSIKKKFVPLLITLIIFSINIEAFQLNEFDYRSASVLPTFIDQKNIRYVILSREANGRDKGMFDDFSGKRDEGESNPTLSAAREFHEEGILGKTLRWNVTDTLNFIDPDKENTYVVIVYSKDKDTRNIRNVTYIVDFGEYQNIFFNNFYNARHEEQIRYRKHGTKRSHRHTIEKDRIAIVNWDNLINTVTKQKGTANPLYIQAFVMNPETKSFQEQTITLRPFLAVKLRPFLLNLSYEESENKKIRFYNKNE